MSPAETDSFSDAAAQALIFEPGLSTATTVTAISCRGVGMDVVRNNLERIGGSVEVRSHPAHGTNFTIRVPLTLTIVQALIVGLGGRACVSEGRRVGIECVSTGSSRWTQYH